MSKKDDGMTWQVEGYRRLGVGEVMQNWDKVFRKHTHHRLRMVGIIRKNRNMSRKGKELSPSNWLGKIENNGDGTVTFVHMMGHAEQIPEVWTGSLLYRGKTPLMIFRLLDNPSGTVAVQADQDIENENPSCKH